MKARQSNDRVAPLARKALIGIAAACLCAATAASAATSTQISQVPLNIALPAHPQIVFAVANSESMDGQLSGAILEGSGSLGASYAGLNASSSPVNYTIPTGFTPPLNAGTAGSAPYTVTSGANRADNSPSRLNVAKAGIAAVLNSYMQNADFALMDYKPNGGISQDATWVYHMSPPGGFTFSSTVPAGPYVANPCYNIPLTNANPVGAACIGLNTYYAGQSITTKPYMNIGTTALFPTVGQTSDNPSISDVLYDTPGNDSAVCLDVGGPNNKPNPYPPNYTLGQFNANPGNIYIGYGATVNACVPGTGPTNAGFVPYSTEVMYVARGFGYIGDESYTTGTVLVPMASAGATPTAASTSTAIGKFTSFLQPETDNVGTGEIKSFALQSPTAGLLAGAQAYLSTTIPTSNGCSAQKYVVLITDGLPTRDLAGNSWPPLGSAAAAGYGVTATFNADGTVASTNDQALLDTISKLQALATAGIKTYVIGVGAGVDPTQNPVAAATLKSMAVAGGTGSYFPATSATALTADLAVILAQILAATESTASAAVNSTGIHTGSVAYQAQFDTADSNQDWTGELYAFPINASTGTVDTTPSSALWSAKTQLDAQNWSTGRLIATWDPVASAGIPFRWNALTATGISSSSTLGLELSTYAADPSGQDVLQFLRGSNAKEVRNGGTFRNRTHKLGDIVDSAPLYIGATQGYTRNTSYFTFAAAHATRAPVIYLGADDGMLHAIDAGTGNELFAYIPASVYPNLINLASPFYNSQHQYFVDGSPQASDVQFSDASWHTVLIGTEGAGGNGVFALDVSDPSLITTEAQLASAVLWDFTDANMGLTFSEPAIANTPAGWAVFVGNGYNSPTQKPFLYALNPQTGAVMAKIDLCAQASSACNTGLANGLSSVTAVNSSGQFSAPVDRVYAGDLQGNLWRIDVSSASPAGWTATVLLQARDAGGSPQPITTAPAVALNPQFPRVLGTMVYVGTGQMLGISDLSSTQTQTIYGVYDSPTAPATPITRGATLVQQTLSNATIGTNAVRLVTNNPVTIPTKQGWYIDLSLLSGERDVTAPHVESGGALVLTTYTPNANTCTGGGVGWLMVLNIATGGSFAQPQIDVNRDGKLDGSDVYVNPTDTTQKSNPVGTSLGSVYGTSPTIRRFAGGAGGCSAVKLITTSDGKIKTVCDRGAGALRTGWWEVR